MRTLILCGLFAGLLAAQIQTTTPGFTNPTPAINYFQINSAGTHPLPAASVANANKAFWVNDYLTSCTPGAPGGGGAVLFSLSSVVSCVVKADGSAYVLAGGISGMSAGPDGDIRIGPGPFHPFEGFLEVLDYYTGSDPIKPAIHGSMFVNPTEFVNASIRWGVLGDIYSDPAATVNIDTMVALEGNANTAGNVNVSILAGVSADVESVAGTVDSQVGFWVDQMYTRVPVTTMAAFRNQSPTYDATVGTSYGMFLEAPQGTGVVTNNYGIYLQDHSTKGSAKSYNIYSAGVTAKNLFEGPVILPSLATIANCTSAASPAVCGSAAAGAFNVAAGASTITVNTTAFTNNTDFGINQISGTTANTRMGVTCNTTPVPFTVTPNGTTGFVLNLGAVPATNPACFTYGGLN